VVTGLAKEAGVTNELALYALVIGLESTAVLDGTTKEERMIGDLEGLEAFAFWARGEGKAVWEEGLSHFKQLIREIE